MSFWLSQGALLECTMGLMPAPFKVLPNNKVTATNFPVANIMDNKPILNITPFILCKSPLNPAVAAIIAASLGTVQQGPCIPLTLAPWLPGNPKILLANMPAIDMSCKLLCTYLGMISPAAPGQTLAMLG